MKREFGKKLIETFLPSIDLTHVLDTSGAYIPGHGTPTVILFGRHREPVGQAIRTVMGIRGEPETPEDPSHGHVWSAIVNQLELVSGDCEWVTCEDITRDSFLTHPWLIGGGTVRQLQHAVEESCSEALGELVSEIGRTTHTGEDEAFYFPSEGTAAKCFMEHCVSLIAGEDVRDWEIAPKRVSIFPYDGVRPVTWTKIPSSLEQHFWRLRSRLRARRDFGKQIEQRGLKWFEHSMFFENRYSIPFSIAFAEVATHNHFVLDRGGKLFKQTAPTIKLPLKASEVDHQKLAGLLNSSIVCFWLKQVSHNKGSTVDAKGARQTTDAFENFYQFNATKLKKLPLPKVLPLYLAEAIDCLANERKAHLPTQLTGRFPILPAELVAHRDAAAELLARMVALQEELDWECYRLYAIINEDCRYIDEAGKQRDPPSVALGERAFEIVMARRMAAGELNTTWFARHGSKSMTELPDHWPTDYRALVELRIALIESNRFIDLVERPEYKRRWNVEAWDNQERGALRKWLLDRLESTAYWPEKRLATVRSLTERAASDRDFQQVATQYAGHAGVYMETLVAELVESESVPALSVHRYKPSGLTNRDDWERTWALQRREDEIDAEVVTVTPKREDETVEEHATRLQAEQRRRKREEVGNVAPPPKYRSADFLKPTYWRLRGALDVPKERFVSLPQMSRDSDPTLLLGWAGWSALDLCQAVATYCTEVIEQDGWTAERLTPLLAVLQENLPWLKQWYNDMDTRYSLRLGEFFEIFLQSQLSTNGLTPHDLQTWTPPDKP